MLIRRAPRVTEADVTDPATYLNRRVFLAAVAGGAATLALGGAYGSAGAAAGPPPGRPLIGRPTPRWSTTEPANRFEDATTYNNFYEFGVNKDDPARLGHLLHPRPWTVQVDGLVHKPARFDVDDLMRFAPLEERIYPLRCVEAWSMVIPWIGYPLSALLRRVEPLGSAEFVAFTTLLDAEQFPAQKRSLLDFTGLDWPYAEGLRLDEALHPLTLLTFGMYGQVLPNQNGAPIRVVVPWKYGFKSAKSLVRLSLVREPPKTAWNAAAPREYGFYANVNPTVDHPRWSQATERRLGQFRRRRTLMFNGFADEVASLYTGMDLRRDY